MNKTAKLMVALAAADPDLVAVIKASADAGDTLPAPLDNLTHPEVVKAVKLFPAAVALSKVLGDILAAA